MYRTTHFIPRDFQNSSSEESLLIHVGTDGGRHFFADSNLNDVLFPMQLLQYPRTGPRWAIPDAMRAELEEWRNEAWTLALMPTKPADLNLDFVERGWVLNREWNDIVLLGEGQEQWIVVHWYTTA